MKFFIAILKFIWFLWICIWFAFTGVIATIFYVFVFNACEGKKKVKYTFYVTKCWGNLLLTGMGVFIKKVILEDFDKDSNYIIVSNHLSMVDIPVSTSVCPLPFSYLAKKEVDKIPFVGYLARNMHVYVDRKSTESRSKSMEAMQIHLESSSIYLFVEGTRNKSEELLLKFHQGAFLLAIQAQRPIAVIVLVGTNKILKPDVLFQASPGFVTAILVETIQTTGMTVNDVSLLSELVRNKMLEVLNRYKV